MGLGPITYHVDVARWQPNAQERIVRAALELFAEQGYENTTVVQIAERAGLTKSTFFRHIPDKRELLFIGQEALTRAFIDAIGSAPHGAGPLEAVAAAVEAAGQVFSPDTKKFAPKRRAIIAADPELQEREALKRASLAAAMTEALKRRGIEEPAASLAAEIGVLALGQAYSRWADPEDRRGFGELARLAMGELTRAAERLAVAR